MKIYINDCQANFINWWAEVSVVWDGPQVIVTGLQWQLVNIGLGNDVVLLGNKPLSKPTLTLLAMLPFRFTVS